VSRPRREQACIAALVILEEQQARERRRERTVWVKPWVTLGHFDTLMQELVRESCGDFKSYLRIEPAMFREMVNIVTVTISVQPLHGSRTGSVRSHRKLAETVR